MLRRALVCLILCCLIAGCAADAPAAERVLSVYFTNWAIWSDASAQVKNLPWDSLDVINHAFWEIAQEDGAFVIRSTDAEADKKHFAQYEACTQKYPGVRVLLSIGGWTRSGYFSDMARTADTRAEFIESCVKTLKEYPFFGGIDLDWEYPGVARAGSGNDQGNPVRGDDYVNYTLLLRELRAALDGAFGAGEKWLTACASGAVSTLRKQDYAALHPYLDRINLMTYDLTGSWDSRTGHHSALYGTLSADAAARYLLSLGVPGGKITLGSPLYSHGWKMKNYSGAADKLVGVSASGDAGGAMTYGEIAALALAADGEKGWHEGYDEQADAAFLWNDDPASPAYARFVSYESPRSLAAKTDYINRLALGGLIVWEASGDANGFPLLTQAAEALK